MATTLVTDYDTSLRLDAEALAVAGFGVASSLAKFCANTGSTYKVASWVMSFTIPTKIAAKEFRDLYFGLLLETTDTSTVEGVVVYTYQYKGYPLHSRVIQALNTNTPYKLIQATGDLTPQQLVDNYYARRSEVYTNRSTLLARYCLDYSVIYTLDCENVFNLKFDCVTSANKFNDTFGHIFVEPVPAFANMLKVQPDLTIDLLLHYSVFPNILEQEMAEAIAQGLTTEENAFFYISQRPLVGKRHEDPSPCITRKEFEEEMAKKQDNLTQTQLDNIADVPNKASIDSLNALAAVVDTKASQTEVDTIGTLAIANKAAITDLDGKVTILATDVATKATIDSLNAVAFKVAANTAAIEANVAEIATKADKTALDATDAKVTKNTTDIATNKDAITTKADKTALAATDTDVANNTVAIATNATAIATKADKTALDTTNANVDKNTTDIAANTTAITTKADKTTVDTLSGKVDINTNAIETKADKTALATTDTNVAKNTTDITTKADKTALADTNANVAKNTADIATKADTTTVTTLSDKVDKNTADIATNATAITIKADKTALDATDTNVAKNTTDITTKADKTALATTNANVTKNTTDIATNKTAITKKADKTALDATNTKVTKNTTDITANTNAIKTKADKTALDATDAKVTKNTTDITTKADKTALDATNAKVTKNTTDIATNTSNIAANTTAIATKANQTDLTALSTKVDTNTTDITNLKATTANILPFIAQSKVSSLVANGNVVLNDSRNMHVIDIVLSSGDTLALNFTNECTTPTDGAVVTFVKAEGNITCNLSIDKDTLTIVNEDLVTDIYRAGRYCIYTMTIPNINKVYVNFVRIATE